MDLTEHIAGMGSSEGIGMPWPAWPEWSWSIAYTEDGCTRRSTKGYVQVCDGDGCEQKASSGHIAKNPGD